MKSFCQCACVFLGLTTLAAAAPPGLSSPIPTTLRPGATVERVFSGSNFTNESQLWTSFPAESKRIGDTDGKSIRFQITVPETASLGLGTLRIVNEHGVTPLQVVVLDDLTAVSRTSNNIKPETAQAVTLPTAISGTVGKTQQQYFRFSVDAGQRVAVDVMARRIGSGLDPMIRILEPSGREIAFSDDEPGLGGDARLAHIFSKPGEYLLELRDISYGGGGDYWYHLRIGDFPTVTAPYPLAVPHGKSTTVQFADSDGNKLEQSVEPTHRQDWLTMAVRRDEGPSSFVTLETSFANETLESEPNDTPEQANSAALQDRLNGRFETPGDVDWFRFQATKGQKCQFHAITREAGSPVDLVLSVWDSQGKKLAEVDDVGTDDAILKHTFAADGDYLLLASDLNQRGGPGFVYRIAFTSIVPKWNISLEADHLNVPTGGTAVLKVQRTGEKKPVTITVGNVPDGWSIPQTVLGSGQMEGVLTITHTENSASPSFVPAIQPISSLDGFKAGLNWVTVHSAMQKRYTQWTTIPRSLPTSFAVATTDAAPFRLTIKPEQIEVAQKSEVKVEVTATRTEGTAEPITLSLQTVTVNKKAVPFLPANVTTTFEPIPQDGTTGTVTFSANDKAAPGEYTVVVLGTLKRGKETIVVPAASIPLHIKPAQPDPAK